MASPLPPNSVFMCYRRSDSEEMVDRIYDALATHFGQGGIFRDIDTIPPGVHFPTYIQNSLRHCPLILIFIGREWANCTDTRGRRRLDDTSDHVRVEVESALAVPGARVIPVMVKHAELPDADQLPESLRPLRERNGLTIRSSGPDYKADIGRLIGTVEQAVTQVLAERSAAALEQAGAAASQTAPRQINPEPEQPRQEAMESRSQGGPADGKPCSVPVVAKSRGRIGVRILVLLFSWPLKLARFIFGRRNKAKKTDSAASPVEDQKTPGTKTEPRAIWSLVLLVVGLFPLYGFPFIVASLVLGRRALARIKASDGALKGHKLAKWAVVLATILCVGEVIAIIGALASH